MKIEMLKAALPLTGSRTEPIGEFTLLSAEIVGNGEVAASITYEFSENSIDWKPLVHFELKGMDSAKGSFPSGQCFRFVRGKLDSISGDQAEATLYLE